MRHKQICLNSLLRSLLLGQVPFAEVRICLLARFEKLDEVYLPIGSFKVLLAQLLVSRSLKVELMFLQKLGEPTLRDSFGLLTVFKLSEQINLVPD